MFAIFVAEKIFVGIIRVGLGEKQAQEKAILHFSFYLIGCVLFSRPSAQVIKSPYVKIRYLRIYKYVAIIQGKRSTFSQFSAQRFCTKRTLLTRIFWNFLKMAYAEDLLL